MKEEYSERPLGERYINSVDVLTIELGSSLAYLLQNRGKKTFYTSVQRLNNLLRHEWGLRLPPFIVRENDDLGDSSYQFVFSDEVLVHNEVPPEKVMIIAGPDRLSRIPGNRGRDPLYSRPCIWIDSGDSLSWTNKSLYSASTGEVILEHLEMVMRVNAHRFITTEAVREKFNTLDLSLQWKAEKLLEKLPFSDLVEIMKNLVPEGIPLSRLDFVLKSLFDRVDEGFENVDEAVEAVRSGLRENVHRFAFRDKLLLFAVLDPSILLWLHTKADENHRISDRDPVIRKLVDVLTEIHLSFQGRGIRLGIICSDSVRLILRRILEKKLPDVIVLKPAEIDPEINVMIVKKVKLNFLRLWLNRVWFNLTADKEYKWRINTEFTLLGRFIRKLEKRALSSVVPIKPEPPPPPRQEPPVFYNMNPLRRNPLSPNLPATMALSERQMAVAFLLVCDEKLLKEILALLEPEEIVDAAIDMDRITKEMALLQDFPSYWNIPQEIARLIKKTRDTDSDFHELDFSPLQKLVVFLKSLPSKSGELLNKSLMAQMKNGELEKLLIKSKNRSLIESKEWRAWLLEDLIWFVRGSYEPIAPYNRKIWMGDLQRIALRSPGMTAAVLRELWLSGGKILDRFESGVEKDPVTTASWILRYMNSKGKRNFINPIEKTYILLQLLPPELADEVINKLNFPWKRIFRNAPRNQSAVEPEAAGLVLNHFLSHYYSSYDSATPSKRSYN